MPPQIVEIVIVSDKEIYQSAVRSAFFQPLDCRVLRFPKAEKVKAIS